MVDLDPKPWRPCPAGELDRLEVWLGRRRLWQTLVTWSVVAGAGLSLALASWQISKAVWPSSTTPDTLQPCPTPTDNPAAVPTENAPPAYRNS